MLTHVISGASSAADAGVVAGSAAADAFKDATSYTVLPYSFINLVMPN
jgi:hypothetical protein